MLLEVGIGQIHDCRGLCVHHISQIAFNGHPAQKDAIAQNPSVASAAQIPIAPSMYMRPRHSARLA